MKIPIFTVVLLNAVSLTVGIQLSPFFIGSQITPVAYIAPDNQTNSVPLPPTHSTTLVTTVANDETIHQTEKSNFQTIAETLLAQKSSALNMALLQSTVAQWSSTDWPAALQFSYQNKPELLVDTVIAITGEQGNTEIVKWLNTQDAHHLYPTWLSTYFDHLTNDDFSQYDLHAMLDFANKQLEGKTQTDVINTLITIWANEDALAALDWLQEHIEGTENSDLYRTVLNRYIEEAPLGAAKFINTSSLDIGPTNFTKRLANQLAEEDIYKAIDWATTLSPEEELTAMAEIMTHWTKSDTSGIALNYLLSRADMQNHPEVFQASIVNIANKNPEQLMKRLSEFSETAQINVVGHVASTMAQQNDAYQFESWLNTLPVGKMRATASLAGVEANMYSNPTTAFKLAENIINPEQRLYYLTETAKFWSSTNKEQARFAIQSTDTLTEKQKSTLLAELSR
ncbi:hypothetical protein CBF23_010265 [Marinomonas agarivorans]|nr:hypothetical protein CBF23_010265 [Marinomonas agarivorans]